MIAERHDHHAPKWICFATSQQINDSLWYTNDGEDNFYNVEKLSKYEESDFECDIEEITTQSSTTSDEIEGNVDKQPQPSTSKDFCGTCLRLMPPSCFVWLRDGQLISKVPYFDKSNIGIRKNCGINEERCEYDYFSVQLEH